MTLKTTNEIRTLLNSVQLDFDQITNRSLNNYLPKLFNSCQFTEDICTTNQCHECEISKTKQQINKRT